MSQPIPSDTPENTYADLDRAFLALDRAFLKRAGNLRHIPHAASRIGGKTGYAEWAWTVGLMQSLIYQHLIHHHSNHILDIGCGTGLVGIAAEPYVSSGGEYLGLEIRAPLVKQCRELYPNPPFRFEHLAAHNALYAPNQPMRATWPVDNASQDMVTALSVWTHLLEDDARFYMHEVARVLKPGAHAIISFFILDEAYEQGITTDPTGNNPFNDTRKQNWFFTEPCTGSTEWLYPARAHPPELCIGLTKTGLGSMLADAGLTIQTTIQGHWKNYPGMFFQDILVLGHSA